MKLMKTFIPTQKDFDNAQKLGMAAHALGQSETSCTIEHPILRDGWLSGYEYAVSRAAIPAHLRPNYGC